MSIAEKLREHKTSDFLTQHRIEVTVMGEYPEPPTLIVATHSTTYDTDLCPFGVDRIDITM